MPHGEDENTRSEFRFPFYRGHYNEIGVSLPTMPSFENYLVEPRTLKKIIRINYLTTSIDHTRSLIKQTTKFIADIRIT